MPTAPPAAFRATRFFLDDDGNAVQLDFTRPQPTAPTRSASGSVYVKDAPARVARAGRIFVEGRHDAELVEKVWGHDLRVEGVAVIYLEGADHLEDVLREFQPSRHRRAGVLLDHLVHGSKESRIAAHIMQRFGTDAVRVVGHPYVDVWQALRPERLGLNEWPVIPRGSRGNTVFVRPLAGRTKTRLILLARGSTSLVRCAIGTILSRR